jgi:hypothetical protein
MGRPCGARLPDIVAIHVGRADEAAAERPIDDVPAVEAPPNEDWLKSSRGAWYRNSLAIAAAECCKWRT